MRYLEFLDIESFRGLFGVKLEDLQQINILVGENNSGKTSVLEAIQLLEYPNDIGSIVSISRKRELYNNVVFGRLKPYGSFINLFNRKEDHKRVSIDSKIGGNDIQIAIFGHEERVLKVINDQYLNNTRKNIKTDKLEEEINCFNGNYKIAINGREEIEHFELDEYDYSFRLRKSGSNKLLNIKYISPIDHYLQYSSINNAIKSGKKSEILDIIKVFDKNIVGLEIIGEIGRTIPYIEHRQLGLMPISTFGDGLKKVLTLASALVTAKGGALLIDEIETAIHTKALKSFFEWFVAVCKKQKVQVFITTHSVEAIDALLEGANSCLEDVAGYRLEEDDGQIYVNRFSGEKLHDIRFKMGLDVR